MKKYNYMCNHILAQDLKTNKELFLNNIFENSEIYLELLKENHVYKYCPLCGSLLDHSYYGRQIKRYSDVKKGMNLC